MEDGRGVSQNWKPWADCHGNQAAHQESCFGEPPSWVPLSSGEFSVYMFHSYPGGSGFGSVVSRIQVGGGECAGGMPEDEGPGT